MSTETEYEEPQDLIEVPDFDNPIEIAEKMTEELPKEEKPAENNQEEDAGEDPESGEENNQEKEEYGQKVQRRINKEIARRKSTEEQLAAALARADIAESKLAETTAASYDVQEKTLIEMRKQAISEGDLEESIRISDELSEIRLKRHQPVIQKPQEVKKTEETGMHPAAQAWLDRNLWYDDNKHTAKSRAAERIQNELLEEGMEFSDELYAELDKRLLKASTPPSQESPAAKPTAKPGHISSPTSGGVNPNPKPKPGQLTEYDLRTMRMAALDPNNPTHRAAYLKRKRR